MAALIISILIPPLPEQGNAKRLLSHAIHENLGVLPYYPWWKAKIILAW